MYANPTNHLSLNELAAVRLAVHQEMADIEHQLRMGAGSYKFLLSDNGLVFWAHTAIGGCAVIRQLP